ncbi:DNA polymerase I [Fulvivirga sedimenti]|uniref:DNA polymerase I n=1 Tax=Fulvivirga sedimenti TaxID=2879465 RepID=A0A9X1KZL5_9BACT|nr:DNA polymerase I [Fulvivirga sedimenti]MCA6078410.1 DNA polymerase I [Fulvivirga sedimenti]
MSKPAKKLFLLDAYALIYRAHFAFSKNPRINSKGLNTGVMLGFTNTLLEVLQKQKPTHIAVAFDTSAPTFRHVEFEAYKANREETPEDIRVAVPIVKDIIRGFNIPILEKDGFEADDVIGTLAKKAASEGFEVFMMTPDKDFGQCVDEHVYLFKPAFMGNAVDILGVKEVKEKWDVARVDQVTDMLGLMGDSVDNIPGIPGIGPKTASKLLHEFGSVEELVANADKLKGKQKENVEKFGEQGILSKHLATIKTDVPIEFNEEALVYDGPKEEILKPLFEELEFRTIAKRVFGETAAQISQTTNGSGQLDMFSSATQDILDMDEESLNTEKDTIESAEHDYHLVSDEKTMKELAGFLAGQSAFCFDVETNSIDAVEALLVGIAFSYVPGEAFYVPVSTDIAKAANTLKYFKAVLENPEIEKIGHNIKYDILALKKYGIQVDGPVYDTMLAHYLIEPETRHGMDALAEQYLNYKPVPITELLGPKGKNQKNMADLQPEEIVEYAAEDADVTLQLKDVLDKEIESTGLGKLLRTVELPLVNVLADMEFEGVRVDENVLASMSGELQEASLKAQEEVFELAGCEFNIASPKQLGEVLFDRMKLVDKPKKTKSGQYATGEEILSKLANQHDIAAKILEFREYQKLKSTYVDALPKMISKTDGRIHTDYNQAVAATGRLSSNNPNLQNIPIRTEKGREIRKAFVARDDQHILLSADYSQIELRIVAAFAEDKEMIRAFREGRDIHTTTASRVFDVPLEEVDPNMRRKAKEVNFGIIYGISAFGLSQNLNISRTEAGDIIKAYFKEFPGIKKYMDACIEKAREKEYVETIMGRRRYLRDINSRNATMRGFAERNAINAPIQGSAADIIKLAMIEIHNWLKKEKLQTKMIMQVHDELVFDVHKDELEKVQKTVIEMMENVVELSVPMKVEAGTGENWLKAH